MADGRSEDPVREDPVAEVDAAGKDDEAGEAEEAPESRSSDSTGPGARLRAAREARGLDRDELARELNLSPRVIRALEEDDDARLPSATFVRGYIRSWARLVDEPVDPLLAAYEARAGRPGPTVQPMPWLESSPAGPGVLHRRPGLVMTVVTLILVIAGAAVLVGVWPEASIPAPGTPGALEDQRRIGPRPESGPSVPPRRDPETVAPGSGVAEPGVPDVEPAVDAIAGTTEPEAEVPAAEASVAEASATEDPVAGDVVTEVSADGSATRVLAGGDAHLHLTFSDDCWVEIRDRDGRMVHRDLHGSGQELDLLGRAPFRVRLGYAPAVELSYNDSRVPLAPHTRNDVASLVIGR